VGTNSRAGGGLAEWPCCAIWRLTTFAPARSTTTRHLGAMRLRATYKPKPAIRSIRFLIRWRLAPDRGAGVFFVVKPGLPFSFSFSFNNKKGWDQGPRPRLRK
jgi:hypothetical protein